MLDVDLIIFWRIGQSTFTSWFVPASLVTKFFLVRRFTQFSLLKTIMIDAGMTLSSWVLVAAVPLAILIWFLVHQLILDRIDAVARPLSWILVLLGSVLVATVADAVVLRIGSRQHVGKVSFTLLLLVNSLCIGLPVVYIERLFRGS